MLDGKESFVGFFVMDQRCCGRQCIEDVGVFLEERESILSFISVAA